MQYEATLSADVGGYTSSLQSAMAVTREFVAANEGLSGMVGRNTSRAILGMNKALGVQERALKANAAEAARYQQVLGQVAAKAVAAGKDVDKSSEVARDLAKNLTGSIEGAAGVVSAAQQLGYADLKPLEQMSELMVRMSAATGESGTGLAQSMQSVSRSFGALPDPQRLSDMSDSVVTLSAQMGGSAEAAGRFAQQIAPFAEQTGLSQSAVLGLSGAFAKMGETGFRSANVLGKVLSDIDRSVREGAPTLQLYAEQMGMTTSAANELAQTDAEEFFIRFVESLDSASDDTTRTLEQLFGEGVRAQKTLRSLVASGDLREQIEMARQSYGSGTTAEAAAESIEGINDSMGRLQETMRQTVANSGAPLLGWMEKVTNASQSMASAVEELTGSEGFQRFMMVAGLAGGTAMGVGKIASAGGLLAAGGSMYSAFGSRLAGPVGFIGRNRGKVAAAGLAGIGLGATGSMPGMEILGMGGLLAASMIGPGGFRFGRGGLDMGFRDITVAANTDMRRWAQPGGIPDRGARVAAGFAAGSRIPFTNPALMNDARIYATKAMSELVDAGDLKKFKEFTTLLNTQAGLFMGAEVLDIAQMANRGDLTGAEAERMMRGMERRAASAPKQTAGLRARGFGRLAGQYARDAGTGALTMAGGIGRGALALATNPWVLGGAAIAGTIGYGIYSSKRTNEMEEKVGDMVVEGAEKVASAYDLTVPVFRSLALEGDKLAGTFKGLQQRAAAWNEEAGAFQLSRQQYGVLSTEAREPVADLRYQNWKIGNWSVGGQQTGPEAIAELLSKFGTTGAGEEAFAMAAELEAMGKSFEEYTAVMDRVAEATDEGIQGVLGIAAEEYNENKGRGESEPLYADVVQRIIADNPMMSNESLIRELNQALLKAGQEFGYTGSQMQAMADQFYEAAGLEGMAPQLSTALTTYEQQQLAAGTIPEGYTVDASGRVVREGGVESRAEEWAGAIEAWEDSRLGGPQGTIEEALAGTGFNTAMMPGIGFVRRAQVGAEMAAEEELEDRSGPRPGGYEWVQRQMMTGEDVEAAKAAADALYSVADAVKEIKPDELGKQIMAGGDFAQQMALATGSPAAALSTVQAMAMYAPAGSVEAGVLGATQQRLRTDVTIQQMGQSDLTNLRMRGVQANIAYGQAQQAIESGENTEEMQQQLAAAEQELQSLRVEEVSFWQNMARANRQNQMQQRYAREDYARQRGYMVDDFDRQLRQAAEQFESQQRYAREDYHRQALWQEEDFNKQLARTERDYNKQRLRQIEDFGKQAARRAEDAARSMYDPFSRIAVEQTWSAAGLATNLDEQLEMFERQLENLDALRSMGLDQGAIDILGLNDPSKAQQVQRLLDEANATEGAGAIAAINAAIGGRVAAADMLYGAENDMGARRIEEDFNLALERMQEDRMVWLADATADYEQAKERAAEMFETSMARAREAYDRSVRYMTEAHTIAMDRMEEQHKQSLKRMQEQFEVQFEVYTTDLAKLQEAATAGMEAGAEEWPGIVESGIDDVVTTLESSGGRIGSVIKDTLVEAASDIWGPNSDMVSLIQEFAEVLGIGGGYAPESGGTAHGASAAFSGDGTYASVPGGNESFAYLAWRSSGARYAHGTAQHIGVDIAAPVGTPIYSSRDGKVMDVGYGDTGYGNWVKIKVAGEDTVMLYGHMRSNTPLEPGDTVRRGSLVGQVGMSGLTTGPHLHFEARPPDYSYGQHKNPYPYLATGGVAEGMTPAIIGEAGAEAVVPLEHPRGLDALANALEAAFGRFTMPAAARSAPQQVTYVTHEDRSVEVTGPITVVADDPDAMSRQLERRARQRALVNPGRSR